LVVTAIVAGAATSAGAAQEAEACGFPYETQGLYGDTVVEEEPESVVTLAPSVAQTVWEIDAQEKVVGVSDKSFVQYLEDIDEYPDVGSAFDPSFPEQVVAQNPDLVVGALLSPDQASALENVGLESHTFSSAGSFEGIAENVEKTGRLLGKCEKADEVAEEMLDEVERVETAVAGEPRPSVMYRIPQQGAFVPGSGTFIGDIIEKAGGRNVYAEAGLEGFAEIPSDETEAEIVLEQNPDWIVLLDTDDGVPQNDLYNSTTAVQENQIITVDANLIQQEGPRVTTPLERMARSFHPDAFGRDTVRGGGGGGGTPSGLDNNEPESGTVTSIITTVDGVTLAEFETGPVETVEINAEIEGEVSVTTVDVGDAPGLPLQRVTVDVPRDARNADGRIRMKIGDDSLEAGVPTEHLRVVRRDNNGWTALNTTRFETADGVTLVADTSGFADFAVVASTEPDAVADVTVQDGTVTLDASASSDKYGEITRYVWTVGDETYDGETVEVEANDGEEVTLTVTNDAGLSATTTEMVEFDAGDNEPSEEPTNQDDSGGNGDGDTGSTDETDNEEQATDDGSEGLPGFTAVVALVAVLALVAVRARRR